MEKSASFLEIGVTEEAGKRQGMEGLYLFIEIRESSLGRALLWLLLRLSVILCTEQPGTVPFIH